MRYEQCVEDKSQWKEWLCPDFLREVKISKDLQT